MSDSTMRTSYRRKSSIRSAINWMKRSSEEGMATAEYAIATLAAISWAA